MNDTDSSNGNSDDSDPSSFPRKISGSESSSYTGGMINDSNVRYGAL